MSESDTQSLEAALASDEYEYVDVDELHKHPRNEEVYGEIDPDESFLEDIQQNGVETPLIVNEHEDTQNEWGLPSTVIGGHRRLTAAREVGLNKVPVRWKEYPEPMATRRLVHNNKQREKSPGQESREMLLLEETARSMAKEDKGSRTDLRANWHGSSDTDGKWTERIAKEMDGVSARTVRRGTDVYRFAYPEQFVHDDLQNAEKYDVSEPVQEVAKKQAEHMDKNQQSYNGGHTAVKAANEIVEMAAEVDADMSETVEESIEKLKEADTKPTKVQTEVERKIERHKKRQSIEKTPEAPDGEYDVLLADPPWQYDHQQTPNRDIENHYLTMSLGEIKDMDIPAADDSVLYLWTTAPKLQEGMSVLEEWGFDYVTNAVWDKQKIGMGYWFRGQHEMLLVGKRGDISPPHTDNRVSSVISEQRGRHSEKPERVYEIIESAFPGKRKVELFARESREGWQSWGDEV